MFSWIGPGAIPVRPPFFTRIHRARRRFSIPAALTEFPVKRHWEGPDAMFRKIVVIVLLIMLFAQAALADEEARLTDIIVTNNRDDLLVYLSVEGAFREKMEAAILSGVPATFSFFITLARVRGMWFDEEVADITVTHTIKYENLKKVFIVERSWTGQGPVTTTSFEEARRLMSEIDSLKVSPLSALEKGRRYQIRARARLSKLTLPFYLHYVFFFVSLWDFETDWYTIDFIY